MPKVTKVQVKKRPKVPTKPRPKSSSVTSRIRPVSGRVGGVKMVVYGHSKRGKTRFAATFPKPMLLIGTEDGTSSLGSVKGLDFVRITNTSELDDLLDMLPGSKYKSVGLDTAGGLQDLALKEVLGLDALPLQKSWGMAERGDWATAGLQTKERLYRLLTLAETHSLEVVIIAHERTFGDGDNDSSLVDPKVGAALTPSVAGWLNGACHYIGQMFIREQQVSKKVTIAGKSKNVATKTGKMEYCLRVGAHNVYITGFRLPPGKELPDVIINPTFDKINELIS